MDPNVEEIDLGLLAAALQETFEGVSPAGYLAGKTAIRDAVAEHLGCSLAEAESLVDTMVAQGIVRYTGNPECAEEESEGWEFGPSPDGDGSG